MSKTKNISKQNEYKCIQMGLNISYYRRLLGYTQEELAEFSGLSRTYISSIEAPNEVKGVSLNALFDIADALNISPCQLLDFKY